MLSDDFLNALGEIYPRERLLRSRAELAPYESDGLTAFRSQPAAVVLAETQQEVIDTVKLCARHEVPFMARGSGTSLSGGSVPVEQGVVIAMNRLKRVVRYDPVERVAVVEPGVINTTVSTLAAKDGLYYAPDPSSGPVCTIGGNIAFNSGGAHCLKYGMTSNHVLGVKVVLPSGEVCELGGDSLEPAGEDLTGMFVGSEGLFGVALEVTLRLLAKPECFFTLQAAYDSLEKAGNAVALVVASGLLPGALEIMDRLAMDAADAAVQAGYPRDAEAMLIVELEGPVEEVEAEKPRLMQLIEESGAYLTEPALDAAQRARIWAGRKSAFSAVGRLSPDFIVQDGVVPRSRLGEALARIDELSREYGLRVANVFHAGDGNLHPLIMFDGTVAGEYDRAEELAGKILRMCVALGGSITGEHGVGLEKRAYLEDMYGEDDVEFLGRLRDAIDPRQLANRGKMLPEKLAPALTGREVHPLEKQGIISPELTMHEPTNLDELRQAVIDLRYIRVRGAGTKPALSDAPTVSTAKLRGVISYDPSEFTFTAFAGTPLAEIRDLLTEHGQFLCFDPPLVDAGATLGGTVASGLSGPGRLRFGGVRDFLLGAQLVTGEGRVVFGGGKVVKNAAGFDIPKLMVGGLGQYGVLAELTFKVFPRPQSYATLEIRCRSLGSALSLQAKIAACPLEPACLDLLPDGALWVRVGGLQVAQAARLERLRALARSDDVLDTQLHEDDRQLWSDAAELTWATDASGEGNQVLARIALTPKDIPSLEQLLKEWTTAQRRYSVAGNVAWICCGPDMIPAIDSWCSQHGRTGLVLRGPSHRQPPILGQPPGAPFRRHLKSVFDPQNKLTVQA